MRKNQDDAQVKKVNQTFSIPVDISNELHVYVKHREMSRFVSDAIRKELEAKKDEMRKEFADMKHDSAQRQMMKDWESTLGDGIDETNEW